MTKTDLREFIKVLEKSADDFDKLSRLSKDDKDFYLGKATAYDEIVEMIRRSFGV